MSTTATTGIDVIACTACEFRSLTETAACPWCGAATGPRTVPGPGTVWSQTFVHLPFEDWTRGYRLVYVDLDDGPRILAHQGPEVEAARIGDRVVVRSAARGRFTLEDTP